MSSAAVDEAPGDERHHGRVDEVPERIDARWRARGSQVVKVSTAMLPRRSWQYGRNAKIAIAVAICTNSKSPGIG